MYESAGLLSLPTAVRSAVFALLPADLWQEVFAAILQHDYLFLRAKYHLAPSSLVIPIPVLMANQLAVIAQPGKSFLVPRIDSSVMLHPGLRQLIQAPFLVRENRKQSK